MDFQKGKELKLFNGQDSGTGFCKGKISTNQQYKRDHVGDFDGELAMVDKRALIVDYDYQRTKINNVNVKAITSQFSWREFGAIVVFTRDGKLYVADGQHRVMAACNRSDITMVPAVVFRDNDKKEEARAFYSIQKNRSTVDAMHLFNVRLAAGEDRAVEMNEFLKSVGWSIASKGGTAGKTPFMITYIRCFEKLFFGYVDKEIFYKTFELITDHWGGYSNSLTFSSALLVMAKFQKAGANIKKYYKKIPPHSDFHAKCISIAKATEENPMVVGPRLLAKYINGKSRVPVISFD